MDDLGSLLLETWIESVLAIQEPAFGPLGVEKQLGTDARLFSSLGSHSSGFVSKFDGSVVLHSGRKMLSPKPDVYKHCFQLLSNVELNSNGFRRPTFPLRIEDPMSLPQP